MDEQEIPAFAKGLKRVQKRLARDVEKLCEPLEALAKEIFENRPGYPRQDANLLRKHFHDIYNSLKLHLVFHSDADLSRFERVPYTFCVKRDWGYFFPVKRDLSFY